MTVGNSGRYDQVYTKPSGSSSNVSPHGDSRPGSSWSFVRNGNSCTDPFMNIKTVRHEVNVDNNNDFRLGSIGIDGLFSENNELVIFEKKRRESIDETRKQENRYLVVPNGISLIDIREKYPFSLSERAFILAQENACISRGDGFVYTNLDTQEYSFYESD